MSSIFFTETFDVSILDTGAILELIELADNCPVLPSVELSATMTIGGQATGVDVHDNLQRFYVKFWMPVSAEKEGIVENWIRAMNGIEPVLVIDGMCLWESWTVDTSAEKLFWMAVMFREQVKSLIYVHQYGDDFDFGYEH